MAGLFFVLCIRKLYQLFNLNDEVNVVTVIQMPLTHLPIVILKVITNINGRSKI